MKIFSIVLIIFISFAFANEIEKNGSMNSNIIPKPQYVKMLSGSFSLTAKTNIFASNQLSSGAVNYLQGRLQKNYGWEIQLINKEENNQISFVFNKDVDQEGYKLNIDENFISIQAGDGAGFFYGVQTLLQLMSADIYGLKKVNKEEIKINCIEIEDYPRFSYRGMHLDVGRHFMPKEFIKKYIDILAMHKMNKFHWHLTEDQGWRIEVKKYPKLNKISSWRDETLIGHYGEKPHEYDNKNHGGFYTQEDVKEIVAYARSRFITIIPEIELPGHSLAVLAAYPELACKKEDYKVATRWGVFEEVYCAGKEKTFEFLQDVLTEVTELFPSEYIHIGGDECPKIRWKECPDCQKRIEENRLKDEHELQSYFVKRIEEFLLTKNRKIIGWDEILEGGLAPGATVMSWRGTEGGIEAANKNHDVIMTPGSHCYFDHYQGKKEEEPLAWGGYSPLEKVYSYDPVPEELPIEKHKYILGAQGNVWTEYMKTPDKVEYMILPRINAMSEILWTDKKLHNYEDFKQRIEFQFKRYEAAGYNFSKSHYKNGIK